MTHFSIIILAEIAVYLVLGCLCTLAARGYAGGDRDPRPLLLWGRALLAFAAGLVVLISGGILTQPVASALGNSIICYGPVVYVQSGLSNTRFRIDWRWVGGLLGLSVSLLAVNNFIWPREPFLDYYITSLSATPIFFAGGILLLRDLPYWAPRASRFLVGIYFLSGSLWLAHALAHQFGDALIEAVRVLTIVDLLGGVLTVFWMETLKMEVKFVAQRDLARAATQAKSRFLAAASHDLRQPMHALDLYLGALAGIGLPDEARAVLGKARQCARTMDVMFRDLLDFSRLDAQAQTVDISHFLADDILDRIRTEFTPQASAKRLTLTVAKCSAPLSSDPAVIERILRNLVGNAVRYTARGKVLVGCRKRPDGLRFSVYDTGPGIASDQQEAVFDAFYRNRATGVESDGWGLGLAIVRQLAPLIDAFISLRSIPGRGSVFSLDVPVSQRFYVPAPFSSSPRGENRARLGGSLITVIDDDAAILDATATLLRQLDCRVVTASSSREAIDRLNSEPRAPDAILCDYRLGGGETGLEAITALREEFNSDIAALIITGEGAPELLRVIEASGIPLLHKPLTAELLKDALATLSTPVLARRASAQ